MHKGQCLLRIDNGCLIISQFIVASVGSVGVVNGLAFFIALAAVNCRRVALDGFMEFLLLKEIIALFLQQYILWSAHGRFGEQR